VIGRIGDVSNAPCGPAWQHRLCRCSCCLGKAPRLHRVDLGQRQAGLTLPSFEMRVVRPGWFKIDAGDIVFAKPAEQRLDALGVIGKLAGAAYRVEMYVECRFRDVDADILRSGASHLF
jgi:hypothetical protein